MTTPEEKKSKPNKVSMTVRVEPEVKAQAEEIYRILGTNLSAAINMFLVASVRAGGFPFDVAGLKPSDTNKSE